jgi:uncharacterized protein (DUF1778 family)
LLSCIAVEPVKRSSAPYSVSTFRVVVALTSAKPQGHRPAKASRIGLRATEDDRDLLDQAAAALGTDRSSFLLAQGRLAAQRVLADRDAFLLDADAQQEWERINSRPARSLPGLERLLERPSPFG